MRWIVGTQPVSLKFTIFQKCALPHFYVFVSEREQSNLLTVLKFSFFELLRYDFNRLLNVAFSKPGVLISW